MSAVHGRFTEITVNGVDISEHCKTSSYEGSADVHDNTGYGKKAKTKNGGLLDGKFTCGGTYDNAESNGPRPTLYPLLGDTVTVVRKPEGTGAGKPQDTFEAVLSKYVETSPVDDNVSWSAEFEISGEIATVAQP